MKTKQRTLRWCSLILMLLVWTGFLFQPAAAAEGAGNSLSLLVTCGETRIGQMAFRLYRVAQSQDGSLVPVAELQDAPISFSLGSSQEMQVCAATLDAYLVSQCAEGNPISPVASGQTDENGQLIFSDLPDGIYLLVGTWTEQAGVTYTLSPALLELPQKAEDGTLQRQVLSEPKVEMSPGIDETNLAFALTVEKRWETNGGSAQPPQEITVALYGDGTEYDRVTLSAANNWQYTWPDLEETIHWQAMELDVPEGYTLTVASEGQSLVITNLWAGDSAAPAAPASPTSSYSAAQTLPQTGQLWWPVPLFAATGLCLFLLGWGLWRKNR